MLSSVRKAATSAYVIRPTLNACPSRFRFTTKLLSVLFAGYFETQQSLSSNFLQLSEFIYREL